MKQPSLTVVTGGASGIGLACVQHLMARGDQVVVVDLPAQCDATVIKNLGVTAYGCDVNDEEAVRKLAKLIEDRHGSVTGLVNCAGVLQKRSPPETLTMKEWDRVVSVDMRGTYLCCAVFGSSMAARGKGAIVNIASITASRSVPLHAYAPAKAAVVSITECLAVEWGKSGVRVNAVSPGYVLTPGLQEAIDRGDRNPKTLVSQAAMGRMVMPSEIADAVDFLLSDQASAITGINLPVDAGWLVGTGWQTYDGIPESRITSGAH